MGFISLKSSPCYTPHCKNVLSCNRVDKLHRMWMLNLKYMVRIIRLYHRLQKNRVILAWGWPLCFYVIQTFSHSSLKKIVEFERFYQPTISVQNSPICRNDPIQICAKNLIFLLVLLPAKGPNNRAILKF